MTVLVGGVCALMDEGCEGDANGWTTGGWLADEVCGTCVAGVDATDDICASLEFTVTDLEADGCDAELGAAEGTGLAPTVTPNRPKGPLTGAALFLPVRTGGIAGVVGLK